MSGLGPGSSVGPYRLGPLLGRGGMAVVYEATHETAGRTVALKLLSPELADPDFIARFRDEGRMQAALDHPHAVTVYEAGTSEHGPWLAMRLVRGTTLADLIDAGALTAARTLDLLGQVAGALDAAHAAGLVHRDVKPRNVLVEGEDQAFLADFGLTRRGDVEAATAAGQFMGTIAYVAPEVVVGGQPAAAADRYALAAVLFECLTGSTVFPRPTQSAVLYAHTYEPPPRVSGRREGIPHALDEVLITSLAKDPSARPARAADIITQARAALTGIELGPPSPRVQPEPDDGTTAGQVTLAATALTPSTGATPARRSARLPLVAALLAGALLGGGAVALLGGEDDAPVTSIAQTPELPAAPKGTERLGSTLEASGRTVDCAGSAVVRPVSPGCSVFQDDQADATLVVPRNGVVRSWGVRNAHGEVALTVMRPDGGGYFQINRSRSEFVDSADAHVWPTDLEVERGDRLALVVIDGSGYGVRAGTGVVGRFTPALTGLGRPPDGTSAAGELLLRADYLPGGRTQEPAQLTGAAAVGAPAGTTLASRRERFGDGTEVEIRAVTVDGQGALDMLTPGGRRVARIEIEDMIDPITADAVQLVLLPGGRQIEIDLRFTRTASNRLLSHYLVARKRRFLFFN